MVPNYGGALGFVDYEGDGPSIGIGNEPDNPAYAQQEMIAGYPTMQYSQCYVYPSIPRYQEMAGPVLVSLDHIQVALAPQAPQVSLNYRDQDSTSIPGPSDMSTILGAPQIPTGDTVFIGRP